MRNAPRARLHRPDVESSERPARRLLVVIAALVATALLTATGAQGHVKQFRVSVDTSYPQPGTSGLPGPFTLSGSVSSVKASCVRDRLVSVTGMIPMAGFSDPSGGTLLGQTTTDVSGNFSITLPDRSAYPIYFATLPKKVLFRTRRHRHTCLPGTSLCLSGHSCPALNPLAVTSPATAPARRPAR
jgi:hypothetical protein